MPCTLTAASQNVQARPDAHARMLGTAAYQKLSIPALEPQSVRCKSPFVAACMT